LILIEDIEESTSMKDDVIAGNMITKWLV